MTGKQLKEIAATFEDDEEELAVQLWCGEDVRAMVREKYTGELTIEEIDEVLCTIDLSVSWQKAGYHEMQDAINEVLELRT